jgi:GT2 family glycosyltransferase
VTGDNVTVTVAIATLDRPEALARCLDALADGDVLPDEVLVVDQGSAAATEEVVRARAERLPGLRRLAQDRRGLSVSRNLAHGEARGEVLAVSDDDCVPSPGWVAAIADVFRLEPDVVAVTGPMLPLDPAVPGRVAISSRTSATRVDWRGRPAPWLVGTGGNFAARRAWLDRVGGWDERLGVGSPGGAGEDIALIDRLLASGATIRYEPAALVRHEGRPASSRRATRSSYGRGVGTWCGILLRGGDRRGASMLVRWLALRLRLGVAAAGRRQPGEVGDEARVLAGTARGVVHGLRVGGRRDT